MKARDIMTANVVTAGPDDDVQALARLMSDHGVSGIPIVDATGRLIGLVSEGDLLRRRETGSERRRSWWLRSFAMPQTLAAEFVKANGRTARDVMTQSVVTATEDTTVVQVVELLERHRVKRVPIVKDGKIVGIISRANLIRALAAMPAAPSMPVAEDSSIKRDLKKAIAAVGFADPLELEVIVNDGTVHLWGSYGSDNECNVIRIAAQNLPGVRDVVDHRRSR